MEGLDPGGKSGLSRATPGALGAPQNGPRSEQLAVGTTCWAPGLWGQLPGHGQQWATGTLPRKRLSGARGGESWSLSQHPCGPGPVCGCRWPNCISQGRASLGCHECVCVHACVSGLVCMGVGRCEHEVRQSVCLCVRDRPEVCSCVSTRLPTQLWLTAALTSLPGRSKGARTLPCGGRWPGSWWA